MRILHTADWHLGKKLEHFSRLEEQRSVLDEIVAIADEENVDVVLVAGDLFDNFNPSAEVVELLYKTLKRLTHNGSRAVVAIAGNHDSADRIEAPDPLAKECGIFFSGYPNTDIGVFATETGIQISKSEPGFIEIILPNIKEPLRLLLTPYANEVRLKSFLGLENKDEQLNEVLKGKWHYLAEKYCDPNGVNVLMAHLYVMQKDGKMPEESEDERPVMVGNASAVFTENIPQSIQYTALGHIHQEQCLDEVKNVFYSGSPLAYSFSEAEQEKFVHIVDAVPGHSPIVKKVLLKDGKLLVRKSFESMEDALEWLSNNQNVLVELTIVTKEYISAKDRRSLLNAHSGIISIIPQIVDSDKIVQTKNNIDLSQNIDTLFRQYFYYRKGQEISDELMDLFKELQTK
ncbi:MAG: exonuclease sbcCD subunit D [Pseudopedobacter saltans]|uniref:Nuclease SbcCD subunit D n=1 Tax=Pseudopedobacter saltans TaxID=151895 RepID=A0A2W5EQ40_9SPHI|nr:MAG: exonuclease sbcCD subunit D [Pseudopedobacter saltans]